MLDTELIVLLINTLSASLIKNNLEVVKKDNDDGEYIVFSPEINMHMDIKLGYAMLDIEIECPIQGIQESKP